MDGTPLSRDEFLNRYRDWLSQRVDAISASDESEQRTLARALLHQMEEVLAKTARGIYPDPETLGAASAPADGTDGVLRSPAPPQLFKVTRRLIAILERPRPGHPQGANPEGSQDGSGEDWNTRLGVPQYRTQSDNLAGPESTCNVTSMAMVMERLGYGRPDVMKAILHELRRLYWKEQHPGKKPSEQDLNAVELPTDFFQKKAKSYLQSENKRSKNYQRPRGMKLSSKQIDGVSGEYEESAQLEDLLDFLRHLKGWGDRTSFLSNSNTIFQTLDPAGKDRPQMEELSKGEFTWAKARGRLQKCLDGGGAAMLSLYHKGKGKDGDGSHIIAVQSVTGSGLIVDDPFGGMRTTYNHDKKEDAYAPAGQTKRTDAYRNVIDRDSKGAQDTDGVGDDWKIDQAQQLKPNESLGDSHEVPDEVFEKAWRYVRLFERPSSVTNQHGDFQAHTGPVATADRSHQGGQHG